ncbi:39S ribosomal protein L39, mitochondrial [Polyodon spathula]|uniref:39S ribosomal protein L39, mitochondrial n=1 Tax=Polyodon spathula TaxID=7913 RepID=UPI001B7EFE0D|nr:39S ribosomal protein L39, mitochondrial [Polyodon spathula]
MACRVVSRVLSCRFASSASASRLSSVELRQLRNDLFMREKARQQSLTPRIEKIEVKLVGKKHPGTLFVMNKGLSTPYSCARHLSEWHSKNAILALVNEEVWDMHCLLTQSCEIQFLTFKDEDPEEVNKAYWRSCAMLMGQVLESAFKDEFSVELLQSPEVPVLSGAFCYDVVLDSQLDSWNPSKENLRALTRAVHSLLHQDLPFEPLDVQPKVALEMFQHSKCKQAQVEEKAAHSPQGTVRVYRCGDFVDLSDGPHIPRTGFCSQFEITAAHSLGPGPWGQVRRFQGLSLPRQLQAFHTIWERIRKRAERLVEIRAPSQAAVSTSIPAERSLPESQL